MANEYASRNCGSGNQIDPSQNELAGSLKRSAEDLVAGDLVAESTGNGPLRGPRRDANTSVSVPASASEDMKKISEGISGDSRKPDDLEELAIRLVERAGEINSLLNKAEQHPAEKKRHLTEAVDLACHTLQEIEEDSHLREGTRKLAMTLSKYPNDVAPILTGKIEEFFKMEENLLKRIKAPNKETGEVLAGCRKVLEDIQNGQPPRGKLFEAIEKIRKTTCTEAERLKKQAALERSRKTIGIIKTACKAIGGIILVAVNASVSLGPNMEPAFGAASGVLGAGLVQAAAQEM